MSDKEKPKEESVTALDLCGLIKELLEERGYEIEDEDCGCLGESFYATKNDQKLSVEVVAVEGC